MPTLTNQEKASYDKVVVDTNGKTLGEDVPVGAIFTDTTYDDTAIQAEVDLNTAKRTYPQTDQSKVTLAVTSDISSIIGATQITIMFSIDQANYDTTLSQAIKDDPSIAIFVRP